MDVCVRLFCVCVVLCLGRGLETVEEPLKKKTTVLFRFASPTISIVPADNQNGGLHVSV
jgi:hypothetical protein